MRAPPVVLALVVAALATAPVSGPAYAQGSATAAAASAAARVESASPALPMVSPDSQLLYELRLDIQTLSPSLLAYGDAADPMLPLGELARLFDLDITVNAATGRADGRLGDSQRALTVALDKRFAAIGSQQIELDVGDAAVSATDILVRASVLARLLPVDFKVDGDDFVIVASPREKLPIQARAERRGRQLGLSGSSPDAPDALVVDTPYRWIGPPAIDVGLALGGDSVRGGLVRRGEIRVAGDLLQFNASAFAGTDDRGRPATAMIRFDRQDANRGLPLGFSAIALGDVYTPALAVGARSMSGAGLYLSNADLEVSSVFQTINLRGDLPLGYDVELYVNDVLRGAQDQPAQGRFEFLGVPLTRGRNVLRTVIYGPRGERSEVTRILNVGGGQLAAGRLDVEVGAVFQQRPLLRLTRTQLADPNASDGAPRIVATLGYGVNEHLSVVGGASLFRDRLDRPQRQLTAGVRGSLFGLAASADVVRGLNQGGGAMALGLAGQLGTVSAILSHRRYQGSFIDETSSLYDSARPIASTSSLQLDSGLTAPLLGRVPLSLRVERGRFQDGGKNLSAQGRTSLVLLDTFVALSGDYRAFRLAGGKAQDFDLNVTTGRRIGAKWLLRGSGDMALLGGGGLKALQATADYRVSDALGARAGLGKSFGLIRDLTAQLGGSLRLPFADLALSSDYGVQSRNWQVGLQLNVGALFDPLARRFRLARPGVAAGASAAFRAFVDDNGNGQRDPDEAPVPDIAVVVGGQRFATDAQGMAVVTGLGEGPRGTFRVDLSKLDNLFLTPPAESVNYTPRAGGVIPVEFPLTPTTEAAVRLVMRREGIGTIGIAAVEFDLVAEDGRKVHGSTEFDGTAVIADLKPGHYRLELDPAQARRLSMRLAAPVTLDIAPRGGAARIDGELVFAQGQK